MNDCQRPLSDGGLASATKIPLNRFASVRAERSGGRIKPEYRPLLEQLAIPPERQEQFVADIAALVQTVLDSYLNPMEHSE